MDCSLYIHFPWCARKCPYCDFNSYALNEKTNRDLYIETLIRDFEQDLPQIARRTISSIYLGGGTPSLFSSQHIAILLNVIAKSCRLKSKLEITMEANPGTLTAEECSNLLEVGINRLSVGVQSVANAKLKALGRIYRRAQVFHTLEFVAKYFPNFNCDLLFGLPQQTKVSAVNDLTQVLAFNPTHLSWYQLTLEEGSQFYLTPPPLPTHEQIWRIQKEGQEFLCQHGFKQYEISAYSKPHYECQHNLNYWQFGDYLGIGVGAHSKLTQHGKITRFHKWENPEKYLTTKNNFIATTEILPKERILFEFMLNALRLYKPIPWFLLKKYINLRAEAKLYHAQNMGLLQITKSALVVTAKGHDFLNDLLEIFM